MYKFETLPTVKVYRFSDPDFIFALVDLIPEFEFFWKTGDNEVTFILPPREDHCQNFFNILKEIGGLEPAY